MCLASLAEDLGADCTAVEFTLSTVSGTEKRTGQQLSLDVVGVTTGKGVRLNKVWATDSLPVATESIPTAADVQQWPHLKDVDIIDFVDKKVIILMGIDVPEALCPLEVRSRKKNQPHAIRTILGWTVIGPLKGKGFQEAQMNFIHVDQALGCKEDLKGMDSIQQQLRNLYNSEFSESTADTKECLSIEDRRAKEIMDNSVKLVDGHYEIGLPWKYDDPSLPNNKSMAARRLSYLKGRLERDPALHMKYKATMEEYISKGHAKKVQQSNCDPDKSSSRTPVWYLPHHPVTHPLKPEKVRVVFDCAAKFKNTSLNDKLLQGPDFANSLVGVLLRFRQERVAVMADIEKMFHQVSVKPEDREALRFLWWPEGDLTKDPVEYQMTVHLFGATSSPSCCSYALKKTAEDNQREFSKDVVDTVSRDFYVDDYLRSLPTKEEAVNLVQELPILLSRGGFRLTKWLSNEREVLSLVPDSERAPCVSLQLEELPKLWELNGTPKRTV